MNSCNFKGNLTADPKLHKFENGNRVCNFRLAVDRIFRRNNETVREAEFLDFEAWDSGADLICEHFRKGDEILVESSARTESWVGEDGKKRSKVKFRVDHFHFCRGRKNREQSPETEESSVSE